MEENKYVFKDESMLAVCECFGDCTFPNPLVVQALADQIAFWMQTAAQNQRNTEYYRDLLVQCGKSIGVEAYTADDDGITNDVLCAKIPELVEKLVNK